MNLVFASGFLVPQYLLGIEYFRGLQAHVAEGGCTRLYFPRCRRPGPARIGHGCWADAILQAYPDGAVHIIAHSMGGLDSRTLIARNLHGLSDPGRIASLTTVSTPHRGSPVADLLAGPRPTARAACCTTRSVMRLAYWASHGCAREPDDARGFEEYRTRRKPIRTSAIVPTLPRGARGRCRLASSLRQRTITSTRLPVRRTTAWWHWTRPDMANFMSRSGIVITST